MGSSLLSFLPVFTEDVFLQYRPFPAEPTNFFVAHWHEILGSYVFYQTIQFLSPWFSTRFFGKSYTNLSPRTKINFDIHVVSMIQCIISILVIIPMLNHPFYVNSLVDPKQGILGYYPYGGFVGAITSGYFVWDTYVCLRYFHLFGWGFLFHGVAALYVFASTLVPFCLPWIPAFLLFELSTPFVNMNWFASRLPSGVFSAKFVAINGILLMVTFFSVRIIWGLYAVYLIAFDMYAVKDLVHPFFPLSILGLNFFLNILNIYWFYKMVLLAKKMASKSKKTD
ncbi:hypothetical protein CAAN1_14S04016 [[Candida] anglica]|uniref:TLC domain-containing protein n=1 Tax=[Candida] anglica TaxID=148631 RepID=A0ABP0ELA8_9ASCO